MADFRFGLQGASPREGLVQPQTEMIGIPKAQAKCITPVSPPIASLECLRMCAVSFNVVVPQKEVISGEVDSILEAISEVSGPPTSATTIPKSVSFSHTSKRMNSGIAFPLYVAPGVMAMYDSGTGTLLVFMVPQTELSGSRILKVSKSFKDLSTK
jgi:hypothetical protein